MLRSLESLFIAINHINVTGHCHGSQACCSLQGIPDEYDEADINRLFSGTLNNHHT